MGTKSAVDKKRQSGKPRKGGDDGSAEEETSKEVDSEQKVGCVVSGEVEKKDEKYAEGNMKGAEKGEGKRGRGKSGKGNEKEDKDGKKKGKFKKVLREAVKEEIREQSTRIAKALVRKVVDGDMHSTDVMFSLIEKKKDKEEKHDGPSEAELLGSEEQWREESPLASEATSEVGEGGRETENAGT